MWIILSGSVCVFAIDDWMFWKMTYWSHGEDYVPTTQGLPLPLGSTTIASKEIAAASAAIWTLSCQHKSRSDSNRFLMMSTSIEWISFPRISNPGLSHLLAPFQTFPRKNRIHDIFSTVHSQCVLRRLWYEEGWHLPGFIRIHRSWIHLDAQLPRWRVDVLAHLFGSWQWPSISTSSIHYDQGSRLDKLECDIPWSSQLLPGLKVARIHPITYIFLHPSDVPACSISVILATTDTQSCLLACSCPNACHAKKNDSGVLVLVYVDWKYHCGQTRQQNILHIPRSSKRCWWMMTGAIQLP